MPHGFKHQKDADLHFLYSWARSGINQGIPTPEWQRKEILKSAKDANKRLEKELHPETDDEKSERMKQIKLRLGDLARFIEKNYDDQAIQERIDELYDLAEE